MLSHSQPNATVIDAQDGSVAGTLDLGGAPEQAVSDGQGHLYVDLEDKSKVAVVDVKALKVTAEYDLAGKGGTPAGLALDAKNNSIVLITTEPMPAVTDATPAAPPAGGTPPGGGRRGGGGAGGGPALLDIIVVRR